MNRGRFFCRCGVIAVLFLAAIQAGYAQENPAIDHAKRILELLKQEKFEDVTKELNAQMTAGLSAPQLGQVWSAIRTQVGDFKSILDQQAANPQPGITLVTLGCQFEKTPVNMMVAFDAENKIAGLRFLPRSAGEAAAPKAP